MGGVHRPPHLERDDEREEAVSERERCHQVRYLGTFEASSPHYTRKAVRAVCDRVDLHRTASHRGRLILGSEVAGIYQWKDATNV